MADLANEKYGAAAQKVLIPRVLNKIKNFMKENNLDEASLIGNEIKPLLNSIDELLGQAKLRADSAIISIFHNLKIATEDLGSKPSEESQIDEQYGVGSLINEIIDESKDSPKIFVIDLPEADVARSFCADIIDKVMICVVQSIMLFISSSVRMSSIIDNSLC
jgi:hypothetical protein